MSFNKYACYFGDLCLQIMSARIKDVPTFSNVLEFDFVIFSCLFV